MWNNWCNGMRMFQNIESLSKFNSKTYRWGTDAYTIHQKWQRHKALSENMNYWPWSETFCPLIVSVFQSSFFIFFQSWTYLWLRGIKKYFVRNKVKEESQEGWPLTFRLKDQYVASFCRFILQIWSKKP